MTKKKEYLSTADVAERYNVTERAVRKWIQAGLLPGTKKTSPLPKSRWRIPITVIEHFEERRRAASE